MHLFSYLFKIREEVFMVTLLYLVGSDQTFCVEKYYLHYDTP